MLYSLDGLTPKVHPTAFIAPNAVLIGDVEVHANASIWFGCVLRGDLGKIVVGEGTNIQDGSVLHEETVIGKDCVIAHLCLVHRCVVGDNVLIGNGALVFGPVEIGSGAVIGAGSVVTPGSNVPANTLALGIPAKAARAATEEHHAMTARLAASYNRNRARYLQGFKALEEGNLGLKQM